MEKEKKENIVHIISKYILSLIVLFVVIYFLYNYSDVLKESIHFSSLLETWVSFLPKLFLLVVLYFVFNIVFFIFIKISSSKMSKLFFDEERIKSILRLSKFTWWAIYVFIAIFLLVDNFSAIIASAGLIGLGLTFALQKPILNFVGWLTVILKNLYNEGDRIKIDGFVGDVKEIQVMNTIIYSLIKDTNTRSHKIMSIPNELVLTTSVENYTKDSNYIKDELLISITYESDYRKAMALLKDIVKEVIKKNINSYIKKKRDEREHIEKRIAKLIKKKKNETERLDQEKEEISLEIKELQQIEDEFNPRVRLEMADSSLVLVTQFLTPYYNVKKTRSEINLAFLDAIKQDKDIEIAYPHVEIIRKKEKN